MVGAPPRTFAPQTPCPQHPDQEPAPRHPRSLSLPSAPSAELTAILSLETLAHLSSLQ